VASRARADNADMDDWRQSTPSAFGALFGAHTNCRRSPLNQPPRGRMRIPLLSEWATGCALKLALVLFSNRHTGYVDSTSDSLAHNSYISTHFALTFDFSKYTHLTHNSEGRAQSINVSTIYQFYSHRKYGFTLSAPFGSSN
jgi:hypothetical protein